MTRDADRDTDRDWAAISAEHPYWAVLSADEFRGGDLDAAAKARFFASGEEQIAWAEAVARRHLDPDWRIRRGLDFGCGVGRLLLPIARRAERAVGVDVAAPMRALTRHHVEAAGLANVEVVDSDDTLSAVEGTFDFINSVYVLQHIPPDRGMRLLAALLARLAPGGVASLQLTYAKDRAFLTHEAGRARFYRRQDGVIHDLLANDLAFPEGTITMFDYDLNAVSLLIGEVTSAPVQTFHRIEGGHAGVHMIFVRNR